MSGDSREAEMPDARYATWIEPALEEALRGRDEGGIPIGAALGREIDGTFEVIARGRNLREQTGDPTAHAEVVCLRNAGRRRDWRALTLVTTLSPCLMCTGMACLFRIPRIIIGENRTFMGGEDLLRDRGVELHVLQDERCIELMGAFIESSADLWAEDIGE